MSMIWHCAGLPYESIACINIEPNPIRQDANCIMMRVSMKTKKLGSFQKLKIHLQLGPTPLTPQPTNQLQPPHISHPPKLRKLNCSTITAAIPDNFFLTMRRVTMVMIMIMMDQMATINIQALTDHHSRMMVVPW